MNRVLFIVVIAVSGCHATTPRASDGTTPVQRFASCTSDSVKDKAAHLTDDVASAVATGDYQGKLDTIARNETTDVAKCAVDLFIDSMTGRKAEADELAAVELARAQAWRQANP